MRAQSLELTHRQKHDCIHDQDSRHALTLQVLTLRLFSRRSKFIKNLDALLAACFVRLFQTLRHKHTHTNIRPEAIRTTAYYQKVLFRKRSMNHNNKAHIEIASLTSLPSS